MRITRKREPVTYDYKLMGHTLQSVSHHPYLGVELSSALDWSHHINSKVNKANQTVGFLRRNLGNCPESVKELAYKSLVRPHVEYASQVWDPWMDKHIKQIEAVQRRSERFEKNCRQLTPETVTNLLNDLDWSSIQSRRKVARVTMLHKTIHGESALEIPSYIERHNLCQLRSYHKDKFFELKPNTEAYRNSFYSRTIKEWNPMPSNIIDIVKTPLFKQGLRVNM